MGSMRSYRYGVLSGLILWLFLLAACGANAATQTGSAAPTASASATRTASRQCGTIHTLGLRQVPTDEGNPQSVEDCFWRAYQQCQPATLIYAQGGVDTATLHTFTLASQNGKCTLSDTIQHIIYPRTPTPGASAPCAGLTRQNDGLHFLNCSGEGNVLVPAGEGK